MKNHHAGCPENSAKDEPSAEDIYEIGCVATVLQMLKLPDGTVKVLVEGVGRARVDHVESEEHHLVADVSPVDSIGENDLKSRRCVARLSCSSNSTSN